MLERSPAVPPNSGRAAGIEALLVSLSGGGFDPETVKGDLDAGMDLLRLLERLWDLPVHESHGDAVFSPSWEGLPPAG
jgi:hypothetical protein